VNLLRSAFATRWCVAWIVCCLTPLAVSAGERLGDVVDVATDFSDPSAVHFVADTLERLDPQTGAGAIRWNRHVRQPSLSFNKFDSPLSRATATEFPGTEYDRDPVLPFEVTFVSDRAVRLRFAARDGELNKGDSLMLVGTPPRSDAWKVEENKEDVTYRGPHGAVRISRKPFRVTLLDKDDKTLTETRALGEPASFSAPPPLSFIRRASDLARCFALATSLAHDEGIYGCGESFTRLNKRGQRVVEYVRDAMGAQSPRMYKPIPFYMSSGGYGVFVHTSTPTTFDFGRDFDATNVAYVGDETLDVFLFIGDPKEIVQEYTALTGRSPRPPLWSFGLWMSRITYKSESEVRDVAQKLREHQIPCDVIHLDTGWFETDWRCDYQFSPSRFDDPAKMIGDLRDDGFRVCLWQLPYFSAKNPLFDEAAKAGLFVRNSGGVMPAEDGVLDFSNPKAVEWYEGKLKGLLDLGVGAIKVDFGEDAPLHGIYASGRSGWHERNLYPLRYNQLVSELTQRENDERIIWARSAWAGSQRYPLHWGGDAENTYSAMAATLRAGMSLGLCGFTYWSHDAGGFVEKAPRELYARWLAMAALSSHTRCHGAPPREPWEYDEEFVDIFRRTIEMRYQLLPYLTTQGAEAASTGAPLVRPLFFEFPHDKTSWLVEDQYLLGKDLLVAPLLEESMSRDVYLPPGGWIDYQTGERYEGGSWRRMNAGAVPIVVLAREGAVIPRVATAQSTAAIDWNKVELVRFGETDAASTARVVLPDGGEVAAKVSKVEPVTAAGSNGR
jgi:alpha-D-xyloside xylohydrolase